MLHNFRIVLKLAAAMLAWQSPMASAQTSRSDTEFRGQAVVTKNCLLTPVADTKEATVVHKGESALSIGFGTFLGGVAGDLLTAGVNALAGALEEASREKGFSVVATTSFNFYVVTKKAGDEPPHYATSHIGPAMHAGPSLCLAISYRADSSKVGDVTKVELEKLALTNTALETWASLHLTTAPDLYVEAELQSRNDGFLVRPALVWYRAPLPGAPKRKLSAEFHVTFSLPAAPANDSETGAAFALARIRLPEMAPGEMRKADQLTNYRSLVMPDRVTTGTPDAIHQKITAAFTESVANDKSIRDLTTQLAAAKAKAAAPGAKPADKTNAESLSSQLDDAKALQKQLAVRRDVINNFENEIEAGMTNVQARFTIVRDANKFGLAIATALKGRSAALGQSLATQLTPTAPKPAWTAEDTNYVTAMTAVQTAQHDLDVATASGDAEQIFQKTVLLKNAKAAANAAAAASKRPLPFNDVI